MHTFNYTLSHNAASSKVFRVYRNDAAKVIRGQQELEEDERKVGQRRRSSQPPIKKLGEG